MASSTSSAWWSRDKKAGLQNRIGAIQRINDPTTNADEILAGSKWLIVVLLMFTGLLGGISYYKNFSGAFPTEAAIAMALALTFTIEWGKNYCATWSLRIPFFRGFGHIMETPANTFIFIGLIGIASATFFMSIYNSTIGGRQLAGMLSHERNATAFTADTKAIDDQIAGLQQASTETRKIQWKGTTTTTAQKSLASQSKALESLQRQREGVIKQQRADWERNQAVLSENSNFAANLVLKSGGWVELLQVLLILLRVSCEKALDNRLPSSQQDGEPQIGFRRNAAISPAFEAPKPQPEPEPRRPIGFFTDKPPDKPAARTAVSGTAPEQPKIAVEQRSTAEQPVPVQTVPGKISAVLADLKYWEKRANQCYGRAFTQQSADKRQDNLQRCECFCAMLRAVGVSVSRDDARMHLEFKHPAAYDTSKEAIIEIERQQEILKSIRS